LADPIDWQEAHSPTVRTEVVISRSPRRVTAGPRRRAAEERFWTGLTSDETRAAEELARVWSYITDGMTAKAQGYERVDPSYDTAADIAVQLKSAYRIWRMRLSAKERSAFVACLFDGMHQKEAAREYGKASTWPRANIGRCLAAWIEIRGWA